MVLTNTHSLCFRAKIRKIGIPLDSPVSRYKSGVLGVYIHFTDRLGLPDVFSRPPWRVIRKFLYLCWWFTCRGAGPHRTYRRVRRAGSSPGNCRTSRPYTRNLYRLEISRVMRKPNNLHVRKHFCYMDLSACKS